MNIKVQPVFEFVSFYTDLHYFCPSGTTKTKTLNYQIIKRFFIFKVFELPRQKEIKY